MLKKLDMADFAINLEKQKKRMQLALSKSQINLNVGFTEGTQLAGDSFKLKTLKFEELLFTSLGMKGDIYRL